LDRIMKKAAEFGIADNRIHIDPLIEVLCTTDDGEGIFMLLDLIKHIRKTYPNVYISGGVSNISYQLPARRLVNQAFIPLVMQAGLNSAVLDPLCGDLRGIIYATDAMLGNDDYCAEYISAYREGVFGGK
ncbi:MAG: dihydropteroate synthase, partial [Oscillospiraceae bacterium]|nr:dihydropteroate synthase [Oscillospiraceae bacterium]